MSPSCPYHLVAVEATTMLCASIILPITPPDEPVGGGVRAGERHAEPAEQGAEQRVDPAGLREGEAERGIGPRVAGDEAEREHRRDGEQRVADHPKGPAVGAQQR